MAPTAMKLRLRRRHTNNSDRPPEEALRTRGSRRRKKTSADTQAAASSGSTTSARAALMSEETSPDSKCPICLDRFNNMAYLDRCLHRFCFPCIQEWSHNKAECPLCKQPFASILHSVRSEDDFKEYMLRPAPNDSSVAATAAMVAAMASATRDQLRLMLRRHRVNEDTVPATRSRSRERGGAGRSEDEQGVLEWYLDWADLADRGVIFEGLSGLGEPAAGQMSRRLLTRLAARLRLQQEGMAARPLREGEMMAFRRDLYRSGVRVCGVAGAGATQPQRDISADGFRRDPSQPSRLRPWLRRELTVLFGAREPVMSIVQRVITARMTHLGLEDTASVEQELQPYFLGQTAHFVHELVCFARSPLSLDEYDLHAAYHPTPADGSGSASSSVIAISEEEEEEGQRQRTDQTPGPSYSLTSPLSSPATQEDEGECMIVGYKKPMAERTPELVHLSSDSERSSPVVPPSTSAACQEKEPAAGSVSPVRMLTSPPPPAAKKKKKKRRSQERMRKSGTLANPNRSIYPAMLRSLSFSSIDSGSPLAISSSPFSWEYSQLSTSSLSLSSSSASPACSSSPAPSSPLSPSRSCGEKPGGKRKYKSRHLDEHNQSGSRRRGRERSKRKNDASKMAGGGDSTRELERERSPSVEIVYEGIVPPKRHRKTQQHSRAPPVITLDSSDSDNSSDLPAVLSLSSDAAGVVCGPADVMDVMDVMDVDLLNEPPAAVCQVRCPPLTPAPLLKLQNEGTKEDEEEVANFSPPSSSLAFLSHTTDLFQIDAAAGGELGAPPSPSGMSCPL
ncbi:E3 ubiquitin-protein ligase Topors [Syngnathus scovelli]|uniref:E3 ubiquitin-protein ligase Topors n=1 Tax=Syngnathus scovelli TaxID=161590 RepID=UPI00210F4C7C|nr:E3 ubiquitin-protein ligase Topors [Syngnathus scovelli]XP_049616631.1 E3 ubiquitin-protein ligase Topors [Syngnathus scovelli]XP_049616640.1 E3 ubiquitin-protein ligase Topors [Syngnathus scovelli]